MKDYFENESQNLRKLCVSDEKKNFLLGIIEKFSFVYMKGLSKKSNGFVRR
jgi:hypothetical protein